MDKDQLWQTILGELEVTLSKANFTTWFRGTFILSIENDLIVIAVPTSFALEWLKNKYHKEIFASLQKFLPSIKQVQFKVTSTPPPQIVDIIKTNNPTIEDNSNTSPTENYSNLNYNYLFETYVVGNSNRLAHAACLAAANNPGKKYNPLFIYGGVGLGKTHLIHAIGNEVLKKYPKKKVLYAPCETFANEFISALQNKKIDSFKKKYRDADVLLIDDIQFLSGKEGTQEEFFHTFNALQTSNRQIILTSDRVPQAIPEMAQRLSSRFAGGMVADIKQPDMETRSAILRAKCLEKKLPLDDDSIEYIAQNITSNIRELEGALNKIKTHLEIYNLEANQDLVSQILDSLINNNRNQYLNPNKIIKTVASFFGIKQDDLTGKKRNKELVYPRQITMFLLRREINYSYPQIGKELGGKDHTTIMHGVSKIEKNLPKNEQLQREISLLKEKLYL